MGGGGGLIEGFCHNVSVIGCWAHWILAESDSFSFQFNSIEFTNCIIHIVGRFKIHNTRLSVSSGNDECLPPSVAIDISVRNFSRSTDEVLKILWPNVW